MARNCCRYMTVSLVPVTALCLAILFALGIITLPIIYSELAKKYQYGMVIDAGSAHTTLFVYQLEVPISVTANFKELYHHKNTSSLDSFAGDQDGATEMIEGLLNDSAKSLASYYSIPRSMYNTTPVYLGATAGMRLLELKNRSATAELLHAANEAMKRSGFYFNKKYKSEILTGGAEAAGGWASVNYLMHNKMGAYGALDMGGASTEIAFKIPENASSSFSLNEVLFGKTFHLYARSYLCYGHNEAHHRFLGHLIAKNNNVTTNVSNPCIPRGKKLSFPYETIRVSRCLLHPIAREVFGFILYLPSLSNVTNATFVGTGDSSQCLADVSYVFNFSSCNPAINCDPNRSKVPVSGDFLGFSGFHYVAKQLGLEGVEFSRNNATIMKAVSKQCELILSNNATNPAEVDICFYGIYMGFMMEQGFGMTGNATDSWSVKFISKVDHTSIGWALGYLVNKTSVFNDKDYNKVYPYSAVDLVVGMIVLTILCAIFIIFFLLTFYACKRVLKAHSGYQTIS